MKPMWKSIALLLVVLLAVVACSGPSGGNPPPSNEDEVIIPATTKVVDQATRDLLTGFTEAGTLHFAGMTPQLVSLAIGDVVVSEPAGAAPFGFIRTVTALHPADGGLVVETEQATLDDAVDQGEVVIADRLAPGDVVATLVHLEGVSIELRSELEALQGGEDKYDFTIALNHVLLDLDNDESTKGDQVVLSGKLQFDVVVDLKAKLRLFSKPRQEFEAKLGFRQKAEMNLDAIAALRLKKEVKVADFTFGTKVFSIGPVPVVYTPKIEVVIGVDGDLRAQTKISVIQTSAAQIGAKYTSDDGWKNLSSAEFGFDFEEPIIDGVGTQAKGYIGPKAILLFYGIAGVGAFGKASGELDLELGQDPHWTLTAGLSADLGIEVKLPIIGNVADFKFVVLDKRIELSRSKNAAPTLAILEPTAGAELTLNRQVFLIAEARDLEEGTPSVAWSSDVDGVLGSSSVISPIFTTSGPRVLTVVATDNRAESISKTVTVNVVNTPPDPFLAGPGGAIPATAQVLFLGGASDPNDPNEFGQSFGTGVVTCDRIGWSVSAPDVLVGASSGCQVAATFNEPGLRTITLTATDIHGGSTNLDMLVSVGPPPPNPAPIIASMSLITRGGKELKPGDFINANPNTDVPLTLEVGASDPEDDPLGFSWQASSSGGPFVEIGATATTIWDPNDTFTAPRAVSGSLVIRVIVSDGSTDIHSPQQEFTWAEIID